MQEKYPNIAALGLEVHPEPLAHVKRDDLIGAFDGPRMREFSKRFGVHTGLLEGPYAWDVERVLESMKRDGV